MAITLTTERLLEASPIPHDRRIQLERIYGYSSDPDFVCRVVVESWEYLFKWYSFEVREIGEERAFWGVVYRLFDDPTKDDVRVVREWMEHDFRTYWGYFDNPTLNLTEEQTQRRAEFVLTVDN